MEFAHLRAARWSLACALFAGAAWASGLPFSFVHHGNFQRMMHTGDTAGPGAGAAG